MTAAPIMEIASKKVVSEWSQFKSFACAARKLQKHAKLVGTHSGGAFAFIDQAIVELTREGTGATCGQLVPVMVPKPVAKRVHDFANSLAVHAVHCSQLQQDVHFAQDALQRNRGQVEETQVGAIKNLHQIGNAAKHDGLRKVGDQLLSMKFVAEGGVSQSAVPKPHTPQSHEARKECSKWEVLSQPKHFIVVDQQCGLIQEMNDTIAVLMRLYESSCGAAPPCVAAADAKHSTFKWNVHAPSWEALKTVPPPIEYKRKLYSFQRSWSDSPEYSAKKEGEDEPSAVTSRGVGEHSLWWQRTCEVLAKSMAETDATNERCLEAPQEQGSGSAVKPDCNQQ